MTDPGTKAMFLAIFCFVVAGVLLTLYILTGGPVLAGLVVVNVGLGLVNLVTYARS